MFRGQQLCSPMVATQRQPWHSGMDIFSDPSSLSPAPCFLFPAPSLGQAQGLRGRTASSLQGPEAAAQRKSWHRLWIVLEISHWDEMQGALEALWWLSFPRIPSCSSRPALKASGQLTKEAESAICSSEGLEFPSSALIPKAVGKPSPS